jgi:calcineurin-like phosphoesterase family protein
VDRPATDDTITDLLRSGWLVEKSRQAVYQEWSSIDERFGDSADRTGRRAEIIKGSLEGRGRTDDRLVEAHANWMRALGGRTPGEVPFGDIFLVRLGDWVEAHVGPFLADGRDEIVALGEQERSAIKWPETLPAPPPFEHVQTPPVEPPGERHFRFGILADLHVGSPAGEQTARAAVADLNESGAELVIQLGDLTDHGDKEEFALAARVLDELQMKCVTVMGNHDAFSVGEERLAGREYYREFFGREPDGMLLEHKGIRFAALDSVEHGISPFPPFNLVTGTFDEGHGGAVVRGALTPAQHEILAEVAAPGSGPAFVFLHHPPQPFTSFPPVLFGLRDQDSGRLHATADSGNVWGVFAGHTHRNARTRTYGRVPVHEIATPRDYPCGYALVDVGESGYAFHFHQISDDELLRECYGRAGTIHRRYGRGADHELAFSWAPA